MGVNPVQFVGFLKILGIQWVKEGKQIRDMDEMLSEVIDKFVGLKRKQRNELKKMVKWAKEEAEEEEKREIEVGKKAWEQMKKNSSSSSDDMAPVHKEQEPYDSVAISDACAPGTSVK